ncbi:hypothetical protein ACFYNL_25335 [Streptomyces sp. NPDC007808]|uniref:hypothetical protein n=1 Tax=Streptomyces sp. NPDC007808 TaxID=3364779 RepID=UPI0036B064E9
MGTAELSEAPEGGVTAHSAPGPGPEASDRDVPTDGGSTTGDQAVPAGMTATTDRRAAGVVDGATTQERAVSRPLWVEEPARRRRMPDPVRTAAVRAVLIIAVTLIQAMVAFLCTLAGSWLAFPMVISSVASTVVATWGALDVWVTRQVWNQRHGVVSTPSSSARALRRERRRARQQAREAERAQRRIRRRGGAGQLSHS